MSFGTKQTLLMRLVFLVALLAQSALLQAQDLEPRRWTHLPVGLNVAGIGLASSAGDILFDPALLIEDGTYDVSVAALSYVRTFDLFGKTARLDVVAPWAKGRWEGLLDGVDTVVHRQGMTDPWFRFSVNLYGASALKGKEFMQYVTQNQNHTTIGAGLTVIAPMGQYNSDYLINLGNNRWTFRPQLGVLHQREKWQFEVTGSVFLYQTNREFWRGGIRKQDPLWFLQTHAIYEIAPQWWTSLSFGYAYGGRSIINGQAKEDDSRTSLMAWGLGYNISRTQGLKVSYLRSRTHIAVGSDTDTVTLAWSYRWTD